jgi:hypothetical protein
MKTLYDRAIHNWRENAVTCALDEYRDKSPPPLIPFFIGSSHSSSLFTVADPQVDLSPSGPSHVLMNALFSLCTSIHDLGAVLVQKRRAQIASQVLRYFIAGVLETTASTSISPDSSFERQILVDLTFLKQIAELWGEGSHWTDSLKRLNEKIKQVQTKVSPSVTLSTIMVLITRAHFSSALMALRLVMAPSTYRERKFFSKHYFRQIRG